MEIGMEMEMEMNRARILNDLKVLPPEIIIEILSRLPADSAIGCRLICKQWRSLIDHPSFVDTHTSHVISSSPFNPKKFSNYLVPNSSASSSGFFLCVQKDRESCHQFEFIEYNEGSFGEEKSALEFKPSKPTETITDHPFPFFHYGWSSFVIGSCNGLVFMAPTLPNNDTFICNPFTREYVNLGHPTWEDEECQPGSVEDEEWPRPGSVEKYIRYGFGYLPSTNEYKIVSMHYDNAKKNYDNAKKRGGKVSVCTVGSGKWRNKGGEIPYSLFDPTSAGALANGIIYWFAYWHEKIVSFDLVDEEFREVVIPKLQLASTENGVLGGCLCVTRGNRRYESPKDIWVLNHVLTSTDHNNNNNMEEEEFSWNKKFSIPCKDGKGFAYYKLEPQVVLKSGKILLLASSTDGLVSFDPRTESFNESIFPLGYGNEIFPYTKSFVSQGSWRRKCKMLGVWCMLRPLHSSSSTIAFNEDGSIFYNPIIVFNNMQNTSEGLLPKTLFLVLLCVSLLIVSLLLIVFA